MFIVPEVFSYLLTACREMGISVPAVPSIMYFSSNGDLQSMIELRKTRCLIFSGVLERMIELRKL